MADHLRKFYRTSTRSLLLLSFLSSALLTGTAQAQAADETARQRIRLTAYGMASYVNPNYGGTTKNKGGTFGGDIDGVHLLPHTFLGLDARYTFSTGQISNQYYYGGGPRVCLDVGKFKPYGDVLFGHGKGTFQNSTNPNYQYDDTAVLTYGGGFDYQLTRSWAIRADAQHERWRYSTKTPYFYPVAISVGASYRFHFRSRTGPGL